MKLLGRETRPEQVAVALEKLEARIDPVIEKLKRESPAEHLAGSDPSKLRFEHKYTFCGETGYADTRKLTVREDVAVDEHVAAVFGHEPSDSSPRGRLIRAGEPKVYDLKDNPNVRTTNQLLFLDNGAVMYDAMPRGAEWKAEWEDIGRLSPADAMALIDRVAEGVEAHQAHA